MTTTSNSTERCTCPNPERRVVHLNPDCPYYGDDTKLKIALRESSFFKPYFDAGHIIEDPAGKCVQCGTYMIDLSEDLMYGDVRKCISPKKPNREEEMVSLVFDKSTGKPTVWCDPEIVDLVSALNGINSPPDLKTISSCSGHGHRPGFIALADGRVLVVCKDITEAHKALSPFPTDINGDLSGKA